jgi:hypothetical protein
MLEEGFIMKCHLCDLETSQLNGLMSRHWKKHQTVAYNRDDYLKDVLTFNGKPPNNCPTCGSQTKYSKETARWDKYCSHACYLVTTKGTSNPNYKGGTVSITCGNCNVIFARHPSQVSKKGVQFCSLSCSTTHYSKTENVSEAKQIGRVASAISSKTRWKNEEYRAKVAQSMVKHFQDHSSDIEKECYATVKRLYPDAVHQHVIGYAAYDIFVPSLKLAIEFDGTYWHGPMSPQYSRQDALDRRKTTYLQNHTDISLVRIPEWCWVLAENKETYIKQVIQKQQVVYLISGPSGSGKSYIAKQVSAPVVYWDKCINSNDFVDKILDNSLVVFAEIPVFVSTHVKRLVALGCIVKLICITETVNTIRERLEHRGGMLTESTIKRVSRFQSLANKASFSGTAQEVIEYLKRWKYIPAA